MDESLNFQKELLELLDVAGEKVVKRYGLNRPPQNIEDIRNFFSKISSGLTNKNNIPDVFIALYLYNYLSGEEVRKRQVSARVFEDVLARLLNGKVILRGEKSRTENYTSNDQREFLKEIAHVEAILKEDDKRIWGPSWSVKQDLIGNKREKGDVVFVSNGNKYLVSVKTLIGKTSGEKKVNSEINIGSLAMRALFAGFTDAPLGDRKSGLGSSGQLKKLFSRIKDNGKWDEFCKRLKLVLKYLYTDLDFVVCYKCDKKMWLLLSTGKELVEGILRVSNDLNSLADILYRWENNCPRIHIDKFFKEFKPCEKLERASEVSYSLPFENPVELDFTKIPSDNELSVYLKKYKREFLEELKRILNYSCSLK